MSDWQDIETAPKDGRTILVAGGACWDTDETYPEPRAVQEAMTANWDAFRLRWDAGCSGSHGEVTVVEPTHWMPLPAAPEASQ